MPNASNEYALPTADAANPPEPPLRLPEAGLTLKEGLCGGELVSVVVAEKVMLIGPGATAVRVIVFPLAAAVTGDLIELIAVAIEEAKEKGVELLPHVTSLYIPLTVTPI